jgi:methoxymalonate biosynthesis acyl carrier protein
MGASEQQIADAVRAFLATQSRQGHHPSFFEDDRPLISSGVLDSVTLMQLVKFIETTYPVEFMAWELSVDYLDTVGLIARTVHEKLVGAA